MRIYLIILLTCLASSCKDRLDAWQINYPPGLEDQVKLFKEYAPPGTRARKLTIVLTGHGLRSEDGILCAGLSSPKNRKIYLDTTSSHWIHAKTALTLHELGHYVIGRRHNDRKFYHFSNPELRIPESVMTVQPDVDEDLICNNIELQNYYLNELFNGY